MVNGGLLGKYLAVVPGGDIEMLEPGDEVTLTQSSINLEDLIGHMIFSQGSGSASATPPRRPRTARALTR